MEINEKNMLHDIHIDISMYNAAGHLVPSAYQRMVINMIEEHLDAIEMGEKAFMENHGLSWILLYMALEIKRRISPSMKLTARTWHSQTIPPYFRRDFEILDENGEQVCVGATLSALFFTADRRLCMDRAKIALADIGSGECLLDINRRFICKQSFELVEERKVRPSMIDGVGHVNNTHYGEFVYDAMTDEERGRLDALERLDVWFTSELTEGARFLVERATTGENEVAYRGIIASDGKTSFAMKLKFGGFKNEREN
jgi:acyl-CoA thioesterase FadM